MNTITLKPSDLVGINYTKHLVIINFRQYIDPDKVNIKPATNTQKQQLSKLILPKKNLSQELKALDKTRLLKRKLNIFFNGVNQLREYKAYKQEDDILIKKRHLSKHKKTIKKYIDFLTQDNNFNIQKEGNMLNLIYKGQYAQCQMGVLL